MSFQTSNFLGRGETFTIQAQQGSRAKNYQLAFTEPFLFDRPMTFGVDIFKREFEYIDVYTQDSIGGNIVYGFRVADFARMFINYSLERSKVEDLNPAFTDPRVLAEQSAARRVAAARCRRPPHGQQDRSELRVQHRRSPDLPEHRQALHARRWTSPALAATPSIVNPRVEGIWYFKHTNRDVARASGRRGNTSRPSATRSRCRSSSGCSSVASTACAASTCARSGRATRPGFVLGGNKSLLFNAEYLINIAGPVRLVLFADAGQVRDSGEKFAWKEEIFENAVPAADGRRRSPIRSTSAAAR